MALAVAAFFSIVSFQRGYQRGLRLELDRLGAHLLVVPKGCPYDAASMALHGANWPCYLKDAVSGRGEAPRPAWRPPRRSSWRRCRARGRGEQFVYLGVGPDILGVKRSLADPGRVSQRGPARCWPERALAAGARLARRADGRAAGRAGAPRQGAASAASWPRRRGADDQFLYLPLADAQRLFHRPHRLTHILVRLRDPNEMERRWRRCAAATPGWSMNVVPLAHLFQTIQELVGLGAAAARAAWRWSRRSSPARALSNTLLMAVTERTREIGVLRALGASRAHVFRMIWLETVQISLAGGVLGRVVALAGSRAVEAWLRARLPVRAQRAAGAPGGAGHRPVCLLGALVLGSLSGLLPAWRAAAPLARRGDPVGQVTV